MSRGFISPENSPWLADGYLFVPLHGLSVCMLLAFLFLLCVHIVSSYKDTSQIGRGLTLMATF
jgi:hypothetical protein